MSGHSAENTVSRRRLIAGVTTILTAGGLASATPSNAAAPGRRPARAAGTTFSLAVLPDTQRETKNAGDRRFRNRTEWLVANREALNLRFAVHSGDLVDWDTPDHVQYRRAADAMGVLQGAGIPYAIPPGNHDTAAVCPGGSACDPSRTRELLRDTSTFNAFFTARSFGAVGREFQPGRADNVLSTFSAGELLWGVLTLELWPRREVVDWARRVVAEHPRHNIVIATHAYLNADGSIGHNAEYGSTSPQYLFDTLVRQYANIRFVFSGHVGTSATRQDVGVHSNRITSFLQCFHDERTNPVRLVQVDTRAGTISTRVHAPYTGTTYTQYDHTVRDVQWVR